MLSQIRGMNVRCQGLEKSDIAGTKTNGRCMRDGERKRVFSSCTAAFTCFFGGNNLVGKSDLSDGSSTMDSCCAGGECKERLGSTALLVSHFSFDSAQGVQLRSAH